MRHSHNPLVVYCHLRWEFVFQRPQHIMTRLGRTRDVLFVEEPIPGASAPSLEIRDVAAGVRVIRPHSTIPDHGFSERHDQALASLWARWLADEGIRHPVSWLYTPMAIGMARATEPSAVIYDCMDELSAFLGAPPVLLERERELLVWADAVFTGGPSLYRAKRDRHPRVHCFPSSVDVEHFAQAATASDPADQAALPRPRLGYYGVIDERIDLEALEALAARHPEWSVVVVGPVVKIDPATLPNRPNLHYLGARDYAQLPAYAGGWDVAIMPFALNASTRFISPTKVLEYMAAERPIASTPITDVAEPYGHIVHIGAGVDGFVRACERALAAPEAERARRAEHARDVLAGTSWDRTVMEMDRIIAELAGETGGAHVAASPVGAVGLASGSGATGTPAAMGKENDR